MECGLLADRHFRESAQVLQAKLSSAIADTACVTYLLSASLAYRHTAAQSADM